ncbi:MAG TPA: hypothetical protein VH814_07855 [Steroidobacteraceae bacterium]
MRMTPDLAGVNIVLTGRFNPAIFQPAWFAHVGLFSAKEAESAEVQVIHKEVSSFRMDWLSFRAEPERITFETTEEPFIRLSEFVVRLFREFLPHTPLSAMGINLQAHFPVDFDRRERLGLALAPRDVWGEWGKRTQMGKDARHGGLISITLIENELDDRPTGSFRITVEPSRRIKVGIYMASNDHYALSDATAPGSAGQLMDLLEKSFEPSIKKTEEIFDHLLGQL